MGVFVEQRFGIHDHAVHTVAALRRLLFNERLLEPVRTGYAAQTFQRGNVPVLSIAHRDAARAHRVALQHYRATAALRKTAAKLWPIQPQVVARSEEHTSELQSHSDLVCRLLLEKKKKKKKENALSKSYLVFSTHHSFSFFFFLLILRPPRSTLFPYTTSSDLW